MAGTAGYMPGATSADRNKFLRGDGTWAALLSSDHTYPLSIAADSGTNQLQLTASTKYKLTAGGSTFVFITPADTWRDIYVNGDPKVGNASNTKAINFTGNNLSISYTAPGTGTGQNSNYSTLTLSPNAWVPATSSNSGTPGIMPAPTSAQRT